MPNQHKHAPIAFRPPEGDRAWLLDHAKRTGQAVNRVLAMALADYRERHERALSASHPGHGESVEAPPCKHKHAIKGWCRECRTGGH